MVYLQFLAKVSNMTSGYGSLVTLWNWFCDCYFYALEHGEDVFPGKTSEHKKRGGNLFPLMEVYVYLVYWGIYFPSP